jgi:hypothetical protein
MSSRASTSSQKSAGPLVGSGRHHMNDHPLLATAFGAVLRKLDPSIRNLTLDGSIAHAVPPALFPGYRESFDLVVGHRVAEEG